MMAVFHVGVFRRRWGYIFTAGLCSQGKPDLPSGYLEGKSGRRRTSVPPISPWHEQGCKHQTATPCPPHARHVETGRRSKTGPTAAPGEILTRAQIFQQISCFPCFGWQHTSHFPQVLPSGADQTGCLMRCIRNIRTNFAAQMIWPKGASLRQRR